MPTAELDSLIEAEKTLGKELKKYAGEWVAIKGHTVVAHADTPEALLEQTEDQEIDRHFRVPSTSGTSLL